MNDTPATRIIRPVDEQRVREIVREVLAEREAAKRCPVCRHIPPSMLTGPQCRHADCPFAARAQGPSA